MGARSARARTLLLGAVLLAACSEAAPPSQPEAPPDEPRAARGDTGSHGASRGRRARAEELREDAWERFLTLLEEGRDLEALRVLAYLRRTAPEFLDDPEKAAAVRRLVAALLDRIRSAEDPEALAAQLGIQLGDATAATELATRGAEEAAARKALSERERTALERHVDRFHGDGKRRGKPTWVDRQLDVLRESPPKFKKPAEPLPVADPEATRKRRESQLVKLRERKVVPLLDHIHGALVWLAQHQGTDGAFDESRVKLRCEQLGHETCVRKSGTGFPLATTALAVLAFLDFRDQDANGIFEPALANGVRWLVAQQKEDGSFRGRYSYSTPIAVMALGQAAGSAGRADVREAARKGLAYLYSVRTGDGGYRYVPKVGKGDVSVTGWVGQAFEAVELAGVEVPHGMRTSLDDFHDDVWLGTHEYTYTIGGKKRPSLYPAGMLLRLVIDSELDDRTRKTWSKHLAAPPPAGRAWVDTLYHHYYAVRVLLALDGSLPEPWRERLLSMAGTQQTEGARAGMWQRETKGKRRSPWFDRGGETLVTAVYALTLEHALYRR